MKETFDMMQAALEGILTDVKAEIKELAEVYDSRDLFGIAYGKFADKIIEIAIEKYLK